MTMVKKQEFSDWFDNLSEEEQAEELKKTIIIKPKTAPLELKDRVCRYNGMTMIDVLKDIKACFFVLGVIEAKNSLENEGQKLFNSLSDIDLTDSENRASQRNKIRLILKVTAEMQEELPEKTVEIENVLSACVKKGIDDAEDIINKLKREGELFEPKQGYVRKV